MRSHRSEARRRIVAHDLGLYRRTLRFILGPEGRWPGWSELDRLYWERRRLQGLHPWIAFQSGREARAISRGGVAFDFVGKPTT